MVSSLLSLFILASSQSGASDDWKLETFFLPKDGVFEGDQIISTDVDIDGDGEAERLVTLMMSSSNAKAGNIWGVYTKGPHGFRYAGHITFRRDFGTVAVIPKVSPIPRLYSPRNGAVMSFGISGGKVHETDEPQVTMEDFRAAAKSGTRPEFREIPAAELYHKYTAEELTDVMADDDGRRPPRKAERQSVEAAPVRPGKMVSPSSVQPAEKRTGWVLGAVVLLSIVGSAWYFARRKACSSRP